MKGSFANWPGEVEPASTVETPILDQGAPIAKWIETRGHALVRIYNPRSIEIIPTLRIETYESGRFHSWTLEAPEILPGESVDFSIDVPDAALLHPEQRGFSSSLVVYVSIGRAWTLLQDAQLRWTERGSPIIETPHQISQNRTPEMLAIRRREELPDRLPIGIHFRPSISVHTPSERDIALSSSPGEARSLLVQEGPVDTGLLPDGGAR